VKRSNDPSSDNDTAADPGPELGEQSPQPAHCDRNGLPLHKIVAPGRAGHELALVLSRAAPRCGCADILARHAGRDPGPSCAAAAGSAFHRQSPASLVGSGLPTTLGVQPLVSVADANHGLPET
jgi:hypothetical protein